MNKKIVFINVVVAAILTLNLYGFAIFLSPKWVAFFFFCSLLFFSFFVCSQFAKNKKLTNHKLMPIGNLKKSLELLQDLSHEMKTPLFSIQGYIETLLDGAMNDPKTLQKYLINMNNASDRLIALISNLDAIHELEKEEILLHHSAFDVIELIDEVYTLVQYQAKEKNVILRPPHSNQKIIVRADRNKIAQVFLNLLVNAISYSNETSLVQIHFQEKPNQWNISISDTGIGIAKEEQKHIFNRFYRVDKSRNRKTGGSGLGLTIVKRILLAHQSDIFVKSVLNEGSTFTFELEKG